MLIFLLFFCYLQGYFIFCTLIYNYVLSIDVGLIYLKHIKLIYEPNFLLTKFFNYEKIYNLANMLVFSYEHRSS